MIKIIRFLACFIFTFSYSCTSSENDTQQEGIRIISLSPGITASLIDMGFSDQIVGRSAFCEMDSIPVVGDLYSVDFERLLRLHPTHVFVQQQVGGIDSHLEELAENGTFILRSWKLNTIEDIKQLFAGLSSMLKVEYPNANFEFDQAAISDEPTLLMTSGSDQNVGICFGNNTYLDDIWKAIGGVNVLERDGWQKLSLEDIARLAPSRILIVSDVHISNRGPLETLGIPIIQFIHKDVLIPSTRIAQVAQSLQVRMVKTK